MLTSERIADELRNMDKKKRSYGSMTIDSLDDMIYVELENSFGYKTLMLTFKGLYTYVNKKINYEITEMMLHLTEDLNVKKDVKFNILHLFIILSKVRFKLKLNKITLAKELILINKYRSFDNTGHTSINSYAGYLTSVELSKDVADYLKEFYNYNTGHDITKPIMEINNDILTINNKQLNKIIKTRKCLSFTAFIGYDDSCLELETEQSLNENKKKLELMEKIDPISTCLSNIINEMHDNMKTLNALKKKDPELGTLINKINKNINSFIKTYTPMAIISIDEIEDYDFEELVNILKK